MSTWMACCDHCECQPWEREGHDDTCARGCNDSCESCGRRGRQMVTATIGGEPFTVCRSCGDDAAEHGAEVTS